MAKEVGKNKLPDFTFNLENLANTIRVKRRKLKLSQAQLSSLTGVSQGFISRIESAESSPDFISFIKIYEVLDLDYYIEGVN